MAEESMDEVMGLLQGLFSSEEGLRRFAQVVINRGMQQELGEQLGARRHERSEQRNGYRNGYKPRGFGTRVGKLELSVPQARGCEPYHPSLFARWQRSERALLSVCAEMYFQGVSTRKVNEVLETMCGMEISAATVSRVAAELDEKLAEFRSRRLDQEAYPYLMVDARYEKVRISGRVVGQAVLVVAGFTTSGRRQILDYRVGDSESEASWGEMFRGLKDRGVRGVQLVVSDAHEGIRAALKRHFQGVAWQRCRVHYKREMMKKVSYKLARELMKDLAAVFATEERQECLRRGEEMAQVWERRSPQVATMLREGLEDCLTVLSFPEAHQRRLASTNMLENLMKQLKHRTAVVGIFPHRASCERLVGALLLEIHESWQARDQVWFNMEQVNPMAAA